MFAAFSARRIVLIRVWLAACLVLAGAGAAAAQAPGSPTTASCPDLLRLRSARPATDQRIKRLVALAKVWGKAKLFHPSIAHKAIDWDAALMAAIPKVSAAKDAQAFADAVGAMLATLGDPATKVTEEKGQPASRPTSSNPHPIGSLTPDGILLVTATHYADLANYRGAVERLNELAKRLGEAKAVVIDLRNRDGGDPFALRNVIGDDLLLRRLVDAPISGPGRRQRLYMGFPPQADIAFGTYTASFLTLDGKSFHAAAAAQPRPTVFVVNAGSAVPEIAMALQDTGKAAIVSEGDASDADLSLPLRIALEGTFSAQVRTSELVRSDGTGGVQANVVVPAAASERADPALDAALELARQFKAETAIRPRLPAHGALPYEARYADYASLTLEHRLLAAFRMYTVVQHFFPYRDIMGEDWDQVLGAFIPRFETAGDAMSYTLCVAEMWTRIHDSHGFIDAVHLNKYLGTAEPPIRVRWIEGAVVVDQILDASAVQPTGLRVGDVVLSVDGEETGQRMARIGRYIAASTPQAHRRTTSGHLLGGSEGAAARLRVRDAGGKEREVEIARSVQRDSLLLKTPARSGDVLRWLPGDIGYADLDRLEIAQVDGMFEMFAKAKAIVFDMRGYPKQTAWHIAPRLTEKSGVPAALFRQPRVSAHSSDTGRDRLGDATEFMQMVPPPRPDRPVFRGLTVMLIDERSQSQSEHTGLFLKAANGTLLIGSATAGANGDVTGLVVPGRIALAFTGQAVLHPDGRQLQRIGLSPDVEVHPTVAGVRAGRDEVLEAAIATIEKRLAGR